MAKATQNTGGALPEAEPLATAPVNSNPALVEFPTDPWGFTSELRKAGLRSAARVKGDPEKQALFLATLRTLALHSQARVADDKAALDLRAKEIQEQNVARGEHLRSARPAE